MTVILYHSTIINDEVSSKETSTITTSSQILLSRDIADTVSDIASSLLLATAIPAASAFEPDTQHIMTLGEVASHTTSGGLDGQTTLQNHQAEFTDFVCNVDSVVSSTPDRSAQPSSSELAIGYRPSTGTPSGLRGPFSGVLPEADYSKIVVKKNKERGRALKRGPRYPNPLAQAESRVRRNDAAIELHTSPIAIGKTTCRSSTFEDPSDPCAALDDNLLEPCPHMPDCANVSEILNDSATISSSEGSSQGPSTVSSDYQRFFSAPVSPSELLSQSIPEDDYIKNVAIKSSSPHWSCAESLPKPYQVTAIPSKASQLPTETIQQIYYSLAPTDYNSARHTCRSWFIKSLENPLLEEMLKRGGYLSSIQYDLMANKMLSSSKTMVNDEWLMSKHISRECALGPDWSGNGLPEHRDCKLGHSMKSPFLHTATVDFTEVAVHHRNANSGGTFFTVSSCGQFLMVANGCLVYIYELNKSHHSSEEDEGSFPGSLRPVTSIICPSRVLACSMDASSCRYAIAILLEGRMGLVCEISALNNVPSRTESNPSVSQNEQDTSRSFAYASQDTCRYQGTSFLDRVSLNSSGSNLGCSQPPNNTPFIFPGIATTGAKIASRDDISSKGVFKSDIPQSIQTAGPNSRHSSVPPANKLGQDSRLHKRPALHPKEVTGSSHMPIENGPRSLYRSLCSDDDPPRSVALCPQRRCVAFGCSSGIELHWVDALTGHDLNRWFPLTAPSDFLYFLPPRKSVDSAKKLRLISSAARPSERPAIAARAFGGRSRNSPFWETLGWSLCPPGDCNDLNGIAGGLTKVGVSELDAETRGFTGRTDCSDHYRAVPLSDGYHILFTDPTSGILCLGSDAPIGGPTKLLRKIWFKGPRGAGSPTIYAGGSDLSWGAKIVAAYGEGVEQTVWLFSVPPDILNSNQASPHTSNGSVWTKSRSKNENKNTAWIDWWPENGQQEWLSYTHDSMPGLTHQSVWPVRIRGQELGKCLGLVDLTVDCGFGMAIWAFSSKGVATVWSIDNGDVEDVTNRWVMRDGTVREDDYEGDTEMSDCGSSPEILLPSLSLQSESFDGTSSSTTSMSTKTKCRRRDRYRTRYDADGDVMMDFPQSSIDDDCSYEEAAWACCQKGTVNQTTHRTKRGHKRLEMDFIARVVIEIH